ncbi:MAG: fimbrillin family protein [Bacteroidales bacterium]|nr:fimbrillin family protein [Candidatus Cacconaster merdequi]
MKYSLHTIVLALAACVLCCCSHSDFGKDSATLQIDAVFTGEMQSKTVVEGVTLPDADASTGVGLFLTASNGNEYDGLENGYSNVRYSYDGKGWASASPIKLSGTKGTLYGYFPYSSNVSGIGSIPVESSIDGTDYMFASPVEGLDSGNRNASLLLKHALSRVTVKFVKSGSFTGKGLLSFLSLEGEGIADKGTLDIRTGKITADGKSSKVAFNLAEPATITTSGIVEECLVVPSAVSEEPQRVVLCCTIDGTDHSLVLDGDNGVVVEQGVKSVVVVSVDNNEVKVLDVWVARWEPGPELAFSIDGTKNVTVKLEDDVNADDLIYSAYPDGDKLTVSALSKIGKALLCNVPDNFVCVSDLDWNTGIYTFTISGITEDATVYIGYPHDEAVWEDIRKVKVPNDAYFRDIIMDAGYMLDDGVSDGYTKSLPRVFKEFYPDSWDAFILDSKVPGDTVMQKKFFSGSTEDLNGRLLYPDGSPRFKALFIIGGDAQNSDNAEAHVRTLGEEACGYIRSFLEKGGSVVTSGGAGSVLAGTIFNGVEGEFLGLYNVNSLPNNSISSINVNVAGDSPLTAYMSDFSNPISVKNKYGVYLDESKLPDGLEVLARYSSSKSAYSLAPAVWAYKNSETSGRIVACGGRPEAGNDSTKGPYKLFRAELEYAIEGRGLAEVKDVIHNGETRLMNLHEGDPSHCAIGDLQCHHFVVKLDKKASTFKLALKWEGDSDLELYFKKGSFAFPGASPDYSCSAKVKDGSASSVELAVNDVPAGLWFVTVRCATCPDVVQKTTSGPTAYDWSKYYAYQGTAAQMAALNGIPYSISALWTY